MGVFQTDDTDVDDDGPFEALFVIQNKSLGDTFYVEFICFCTFFEFDYCEEKLHFN